MSDYAESLAIEGLAIDPKTPRCCAHRYAEDNIARERPGLTNLKATMVVEY
jgi:hypothetical protein